MEDWEKSTLKSSSFEGVNLTDPGNPDMWTEPEYNREEFLSRPYLSTYSTLKDNVFEFVHSFGYDSSRRSNLCVADDHTVVYLSGNYIHVYDTNTGQTKFIRSLSGIGLGHISKHPIEDILAVGERGERPLIILYNYPEFTINRLLKGGTEKSYNYISFSTDGEWLISQGGEPDNSLTIWNWKLEKLVLKEKVGRETWKAESNPFVKGEIITSGANFIMFWMITETFTGLKLKRYPGKFGGHAFCDICTFCGLPKGKVVSPNQTNNLYVWRGEEITMEVRRSGKLPLHDEKIVFLEYKETCNEIYSVGQEGTFKVWDFTRVNNASKKVGFVELQPTYHRKLQDKYDTACPMSFQKQFPNDCLSSFYYMQDKRGSIWLTEMNVKANMMPPKRVLMAHESPLGDIAPAPTDYYFATIGAEGKLHVYSILTKKIMMFKKFKTGGSSLLWLPLSVDSTGSILLVGFIDGSVRIVVMSIPSKFLQPMEDNEDHINVIQVLKPHNEAVTAISLNPHRNERKMVLTCSLDRKVFIYWLEPLGRYLNLQPSAFVEIPGAIHHITWNPSSEAFLVSTDNGIIVEVVIPKELPIPLPNTYRIYLQNRLSYFSSIKSQIIRKNVMLRNFQRKQRRLERSISHRKKDEMLNIIEVDQVKHKVMNKKKIDMTNKRTKKILKEIKKKWRQEREIIKYHSDKKILSTEIEEEYDKYKQKIISFLNNLPLSVFLKEEREELLDKESQLFLPKLEESSSDDSIDSSDGEGEISADEAVPQLYIPPDSSPIYFVKYIDADSFWVSAGSYDCGYIYQYKLGESTPYKSTPISIGDIEMISYKDIFHGEYSVFGLGNGGVQIVKNNPTDPVDFSDYCMSIMHDNITGKVRKICTSYDERYLLSVGDDANIFLYQLNIPEKLFPEKYMLPECTTLPSRMRAEDTVGPNTLSLEDALILAEEVKRKKMGEERVSYLKGQLNCVLLRFQILLELNESLPVSQRLPDSFFVIDEEYKDINNKTLSVRKANLTKSTELEFLKEKTKRDMIFSHYIQPVRVFKVYLFGIEHANRVTSFYQSKISMLFLQAEKEAEATIIDILKRGSEKQLNPLKVPKVPVPHRQFRRSRLVVRPLVQGEDEVVKLLDSATKTLYTRLSKRRERRKLLSNILTLFLEEKDWKKKQFSKDIESRKEEKIDMRYVLKSDPNYNLNNLRKITTEKKFYQLITTKRKIHDLMSHFNAQILKLREKKSKIVALYNESLKDAITILSEFSEVELPNPPEKISIIEPLEFPELYFMDFPPEFPHKRDSKDMYRNQMCCQLYEINKKFPISNKVFLEEQNEKLLRMKEVMSLETLEKTGVNRLWEKEFIEERKNFLIGEFYKKGQIIRHMISEYDEELEKLAFLKVDYEIKIHYLKLFYQKYYEELQIVRSHQLLENNISKKLEVFLVQKHIYILRINIKNKNIINCLHDIATSTKRIEKISKAFTVLISKISTKLKRHLSHLFKKKWKPEKIRHGDDESSSSEDEDEEEEDEEEDEEEEEDDVGEMYIEDLLAMDHRPVDERTKPEGLDDYTFDETFNLRDLRQAEEKRIFDKKAEIQDLYDRIGELRNTLLAIETFIAFYRVKLSYVLEEKHKKLSSVRTVVILDASQMQHFDVERNEFPPVKDTILFPLYNLKNLETRKRKLKEDIINVQLKKQETVKHVKRLDLDINFLRKKLTNLKNEIDKAKIEKFGVPVNIEKLEERTLLKIIKDLKYNTLPFHMKFHVDIVKLQKEFEKVDLSITEHVKKNTYEELKYGALLEQKRMYEKCIEKLKFQKLGEYMPLEDIKKNIHELLAVVNIQEDRIECLENEINRLKYASYIPDISKKKKVVALKEIKDLLGEEDQSQVFLEEGECESVEDHAVSEFEVISKMSESNIVEAFESEVDLEEDEKIFSEDIEDYLTMEEDEHLEYESSLHKGNTDEKEEMIHEEGSEVLLEYEEVEDEMGEVEEGTEEDVGEVGQSGEVEGREEGTEEDVGDVGQSGQVEGRDEGAEEGVGEVGQSGQVEGRGEGAEEDVGAVGQSGEVEGAEEGVGEIGQVEGTEEGAEEGVGEVGQSEQVEGREEGAEEDVGEVGESGQVEGREEGAEEGVGEVGQSEQVEGRDKGAEEDVGEVGEIGQVEGREEVAEEVVGEVGESGEVEGIEEEAEKGVSEEGK